MTQFEKVIVEAKPFLGPAAESFISRQCKAHLKIEASALTAANMKELAKWAELGAGLLMEGTKAAVLAQRIAALT
jgi:hypothetical protein